MAFFLLGPPRRFHARNLHDTQQPPPQVYHMSRRAQRLRYRDEESSASVYFLIAGAVAGAAAGVLLAQRYGGLAGLSLSVHADVER